MKHEREKTSGNTVDCDRLGIINRLFDTQDRRNATLLSRSNHPISAGPSRSYRHRIISHFSSFFVLFVSFVVLVLGTSLPADEPVQISPSLKVVPGPVNGVVISSGGHRLAVYGDPRREPVEVDQVLFTHHRRDVTWAGRAQVEAGAKAIVPEQERMYFEAPEEQWRKFIAIRLKDTAQQSTKMITRPLPVARGVREGETIDWQGLNFEVLATPGFTRDAVTYVTKIDDQKVAFTGDLIYGDGQIFDLYSFQDAIPEAKIGGYHGYVARFALLIDSLEKVAIANPDIVVPTRGPVITEPQQAIAKLIRRVRAFYRNYLSTNALYWYFKEERMQACAERILGPGADFQLMPYSHYEETPPWIHSHTTTRLIISETGAAFMLDCGTGSVIKHVKGLMQQGLIKKIEGLFITHYHGDHVHYVQEAAEEFGCPVYATTEYEDILENPGAYHMAAMTPNPVGEVIGKPDGTVMKWREYELTFRFYPGQAYYHGALLVKNPEGKRVFLVGDAFTPSGMDDYCLLNRNLLHEDTGYLRCFRILKELAEEGDYYLINQHVPYFFQYTTSQLDYLESTYRERIEMIRELVPWDDPNYGVDEQWAWFYPYGQETKAGKKVNLEFRLWNHSPKDRLFTIRPHLPAGLTLLDHALSVEIPAGGRKTIPISVYLSKDTAAGDHIVTADVFSEGIALREWSEAIVTVKGE